MNKEYPAQNFDAKENQISKYDGHKPDLIQKNIKIINENSYSDYNENTLKKVIEIFNQFLQQLNNEIPIQDCDNLQQNTQMKQNILSLIKKAQLKIFSLQKKLQYHDEVNQKLNSTLDLFKFEDFNETLDSKESKTNYIGNQQEEKQDQADNTQLDNENCIINHKYIQNYQEFYQTIAQTKLEQNLKNDDGKLLKCFCKKNIIFQNLSSVSNKNLFDKILIKQLEKIFQQSVNFKVLKCQNQFCNFKCQEKKSHKDQFGLIKSKSYCPLCEENSVE